ncbi:zinc metalloprotease HtpX, partial [Candidatus Kaiserbacteria bacterium]
MSVFFLVIVLVGWFTSEYFGNPGILIFAIIFSVGMNGTSFWFSDKIAIRSAGAKEADGNQYKDLHNIVENLAITA